MNKFVPVVVAIIRNKKDEYLLTQRHSPELPNVHLKWQLVGGKIEFGETTEETLKRECLEEIGQPIKIISKLPTVKTHIWNHPNRSPEHTLLIGYLCELADEKTRFTLNEETHSYKWFTLEKLKKLDLLPETAEMIEDLQ